MSSNDELEMADKKYSIPPLGQDELSELQKTNPEAVFIPMTERQFQERQKILEELHEGEEKFPILKHSVESLKLFGLQMELNSHHLEFIEKLEYLPLKAAIQNWLIDLGQETRLKYAEYITDMFKRQIIHEFFADGKTEFTIGGFRHIRHEAVIQYIKNVPEWTEYSRQSRVACYISLTAYLYRISYGWFRRALPSDSEANKTFYRLSPKVVARALSLENWHIFINVLDEINHRDSLIARCMLHGGQRVSEVLSLKIDQIDFEKNIIRFTQKNKNKQLEFPNVYPACFINELKDYIQSTNIQRKASRFIFITSKGKSLTRSRLNYSFAYASNQSGLAKVTPEVLRATWITLSRRDIIDDEILRIKRGQSCID